MIFFCKILIGLTPKYLHLILDILILYLYIIYIVLILYIDILLMIYKILILILYLNQMAATTIQELRQIRNLLSSIAEQKGLITLSVSSALKNGTS